MNLGRISALAAAALLASASDATASRGDFGPTTVVTSTAGAQANGPSASPAVSADGRFVVFTSNAINLYGSVGADRGWSGGGIFRKDLDSSEIDVVVPATVDGASGSPGIPSVSSDGRYVVFDTRLPLVPQDTNATFDVYRRDLQVPIDDPAAFALVSVGTGQDTPLNYGSALGARVARQSTSADGGVVIFAIAGTSNTLAPEVPTLATGAGAVAVRDIAAKTTEVVNLTASGDVPVFTSARAGLQTAPSITANGKIALWYADGAEVYHPNVRDRGFQTLVARAVGASASSTRVVAGASDPEDPACTTPAGPSTSIVPQACDGVTYVNTVDAQPISSYAASADGSTVAVAIAGRANALLGPTSIQPDLVVVDMTRPGPRKAATRAYTAGTTASSGVGAGAVTMTGDAGLVSFTAESWAPNVNPPTPAGVFPPGSVTQPYLIDRVADTIRLVGAGFDGAVLNGGVGALSLSLDGTTLAMQTSATNLFFGDANSADDIAVRREVRLGAPPVSLSEPAPRVVPAADPEPAAYLAVRAAPTTTGGVRVTLGAPWAGRVTIDVRQRPTTSTKAARTKTLPRLLQSVSVAVPSGRSTSQLVPRAKYVKALRRTRGVPAAVVVTLTSPGRATLTRSLPITLRRTAKVPATKRSGR